MIIKQQNLVECTPFRLWETYTENSHVREFHTGMTLIFLNNNNNNNININNSTYIAPISILLFSSAFQFPLYLILPNTESSCSLIQGCQISYIPYICHIFTTIMHTGICPSGLQGGCLHDTGTTFAPYRVYMMMGYFISRLFEGALHVDKVHVRFKIANITYGPPIDPAHLQTDYTPKRVVVSCLHDTVAKFCTTVNF